MEMSRLLAVCVLTILFPGSPAMAQSEVVLRAGKIIVGDGTILLNRDIHIVDGRITQITPRGARFDYDASRWTLMPGWIDTHSHVAARFDRAGKIVFPNSLGDETTESAALSVAANGWKTLRAGFTTIQSPGDRLDVPLAQVVRDTDFPGPRVLTSIGMIQKRDNQTPSEVRAQVKELHAAGADVIKIFADGHFGIGETLTKVACGEARSYRMRSMVHAMTLEGVYWTVRGDCSSVEHGEELDSSVLELMREKNIYYSPSLDIPVHYARFEGKLPEAATYKTGDIAAMPEEYRSYVATFSKAVKAGVRIVYATDAVAGVHGNNADEFVWRVVDGHQDPMDAIASATSVAAQWLGLGDVVGLVKPGFQADFVATTGDPLADIRHVKSVRFVMKRGIVYRNDR